MNQSLIELSEARNKNELFENEANEFHHIINEKDNEISNLNETLKSMKIQNIELSNNLKLFYIEKEKNELKFNELNLQFSLIKKQFNHMNDSNNNQNKEKIIENKENKEKIVKKNESKENNNIEESMNVSAVTSRSNSYSSLSTSDLIGNFIIFL